MFWQNGLIDPEKKRRLAAKEGYTCRPIAHTLYTLKLNPAPLSCPLQNSNHSRDKLLGSCGDKTQYSWSIRAKKIGRPLPHIGLLSKKSNNDYFDVRVLIEILIEH